MQSILRNPVPSLRFSQIKPDNPKALSRNQSRVTNLFKEKSLHDEDSINPRYKIRSPGFITLGFRYDAPKGFGKLDFY